MSNQPARVLVPVRSKQAEAPLPTDPSTDFNVPTEDQMRADIERWNAKARRMAV